MFFLLEEAATGNPWITFGFIGLMLVALWFFMIRPQKKQEREAAQLRENLRVGDEVTTIGGIVGKIVSLREETVVIETTKDKTHIRFLRAAIRSVDVCAEDSTPPAPKAPVEAAPKKRSGKKAPAPAAEVVEESGDQAVEDITPAETPSEETEE